MKGIMWLSFVISIHQRDDKFLYMFILYGQFVGVKKMILNGKSNTNGDLLKQMANLQYFFICHLKNYNDSSFIQQIFLFYFKQGNCCFLTYTSPSFPFSPAGTPNQISIHRTLSVITRINIKISSKQIKQPITNQSPMQPKTNPNNNLHCKLCDHKYRQPRMCPHCSEVFCQKCIVDYLAEKHFCPSCDNYIIDLVDCGRLVREVEEVVTLKQRDKQEQDSSHNNHKNKFSHKLKTCPQHQLQLSYYCRDCKTWLCSDCGVIEQKHQGHTIVTKSQAVNKQNLAQLLIGIGEKIYKLHHRKEKCVLDLEVYRTEIKWCKTQITQYCQELLARADAEGVRNIKQFEKKINEYNHKLAELKERQNQLQTMLMQINNSNRQQNRRPNAQGNLSALDQEQLLHNLCSSSSEEDQLIMNEFFVEKSPKIQIIDQIIPQFTNFTYEFDYSNNSEELYHYSDYFELWGQEWRLKIYPKGNSDAKGKYLSVFLQLKNGYHSQKPKKYVYRLELLSLNKAGCTIVKQYCSAFDIGQCWGYSDYLNLIHLPEYLHEGTLLFSIGIRNHSYAGLSGDLKKYVTKMQKQTKLLQKLVCEGNYQSSRMEEGNARQGMMLELRQESQISQKESEDELQSEQVDASFGEHHQMEQKVHLYY